MLQRREIYQCQVHKEDFIAIDISPDCDDQSRHCCAECIKQKQSQEILTYKQADQYFKKVKKEFQVSKESQMKQNLEILRQLEQSFILNQKDYNNMFNKLVNSIKQQITYIQEDIGQLQTKLTSINIDSYLSGNNDLAQSFDNLLSFKQDLKSQLDEITKDSKQLELKSQIELLNTQKITFFPELIQKKQTKPNIIDYSLSFLCSAHNQEIQMFDLNGTIAIENRMICDGCLKYRNGKFTHISEVYQLWEDYKEKQRFYLAENIQIVKCKIEPLIKLMSEFKEEISNRISKQIFMIGERARTVEEKLDNNIKQQQSMAWSKLNFFQIQEIIQALINPNYILNVSLDEIKEFQEFNNYLENMINNFLIEYVSMKGYLYENINKIGFKLTIQEPTQKKPENTDQANYQIIQGSQIQNEQCDAIILSQDQQTLVFGCGKLIHVYNFDQGKLYLKQTLKQHKTNLTKLSFMISSKQFVSIDSNYLLIWIFLDEKWECDQQLQLFHSDNVQCLLFNHKDNQIITGSFDRNIKFWIKKDYWELGYTLQIHDGQILDMNLNDKQNQLVSCGYIKPGFFTRSEGQLFISEKDKKDQWAAIQTIKSEKQVNRVCYIGDEKLIYQTKSDLTLLVQNQKKVFEVQKILFNINEDKIIFPLIFNKSKQLLVYKNKNIINVVKLHNNGDYYYQQMIIAKSDNIIGILSADAQYFIIWDAESQQIQVRYSQ